MANVRSNQLFIECVCVWIVDVVVDTSLEIEASGLPELLHIVVAVVIVKKELREVADEEESKEVGFEASIEGLEV